jgi:hypothetical protein
MDARNAAKMNEVGETERVEKMKMKRDCRETSPPPKGF